MGLQRTPPKSAAASLLPRPLPPAYPEGEAPPPLPTTTIPDANKSASPQTEAGPRSSSRRTGSEEASQSARKTSGRKRSIQHVEEEAEEASTREATTTTAGASTATEEEGQPIVRNNNKKRQSFRPTQIASEAATAPTHLETLTSMSTEAAAPELINADLEGTGLVTEEATPPTTTESSSLTAPVGTTNKQGSVAGSSAAASSSNTMDAFSGTSNRRKRSSEVARTVTAEVATGDEQSEGADTDYGKHYGLLLQALEVAVRKGANKWTAKDFKQCFPTISGATPERAQIFDAIWERTAAFMRETMLDHAKHILVEYQTGPGLLRLHRAVQQARADQQNGVRRADAWRPNLTPHALVAATNLPQHDETYSKLRQEFVELTENNAALAHDIENKLARCRAIEGETRESIEQLEKTVKILDGFPTAEMQEWMTDVAGNLEGQRGP